MEPTPAGETIADIIGLPILSSEQAEKLKEDENRNIVYRALTTQDVINLSNGKGILSKHTVPYREWTLLEHVTWGGADSSGVDISIGHDPWIATTIDLDIAQKFNSKGDNRGIVVIDLNLVTSKKAIPMYEFWGREDFEGELAYAYGEAEKEVSIYQIIQQSAIVGYIP